MTFITESELNHYVQPLLCTDELPAREVFIAATFSQLCEPGDRSFSALGAPLGADRLLELLIARADALTVLTKLEPLQVQEVEQVFEQPFEEIWQGACQRWLPRLNRADVFASLDQAKALGARLVPRFSAFYPAGLEDLGDGQPPLLWVLGDAGLLNKPAMVSIVGSRNTSSYGRAVASDLGVVAADNGIVTVSGGAFGIDACVHQATISAGGQTIAAMAGGIGRLYPPSNKPLLESVAKTGALFSEMPPGVAPAKWRFLMRNRLIAAMGMATVVVQAGLKSGSINTANTALQLGRRVAIVPGQLNSAYSIGCHNFLNDKLGLVELIADAKNLPDLLGERSGAGSLPPGLGTLETRALDAFVAGVNTFEQVLREAGLTSKEGMRALGSLEMEGLVTRVGSGYKRVAK
jgi:DNA processing protein